MPTPTPSLVWASNLDHSERSILHHLYPQIPAPSAVSALLRRCILTALPRRSSHWRSLAVLVLLPYLHHKAVTAYQRSLDEEEEERGGQQVSGYNGAVKIVKYTNKRLRRVYILPIRSALCEMNPWMVTI